MFGSTFGWVETNARNSPPGNCAIPHQWGIPHRLRTNALDEDYEELDDDANVHIIMPFMMN